MTTDNSNHFDVIVIGGGAIGLATAWQLQKRKCKTLILEQFEFRNQLGSSAGVSRQYRIPYPEDYMVQMALDAQPYWDELQKYSAIPLLDKVGTLWFGDPNVHSTEGNIAEAEKSLQALNVPYVTLTAREIEDKYHFRNLPDTYTGLFQPDGASINFKSTIDTLFQLNRTSEYVTLHEGARVTGIRPDGTGFEVVSSKGRFTCDKLAIIPGPYVDDVINLLDFTIEATYWNMSSAYFKKTDRNIQYPTWFVFQDPEGENGNQFYGFPNVAWDHDGFIRVAPDFVIDPLNDPGERTLTPNPQELAYTSEWVKNHMTGLDPEPHFTSTCLIALSKIENKELLIDFAPPYVPNHKNIVVYATGWAAKFTPYLGKIMADLALDGHTDFDISPFRLGNKYFKALVKPTH